MVEIKDGKEVTSTKNGRKFFKGICPNGCTTNSGKNVIVSVAIAGTGKNTKYTKSQNLRKPIKKRTKKEQIENIQTV